MKLLSMTLIPLVALATVAQATEWHYTWAHPTPVGNPLYGTAFASGGRGFAVGSLGAVLRTDDDGTSWTRLQGYDTLGHDLLDVAVIDPMTIVAVGDGIWRSTDGGETFTEISSPASGLLRDVAVIPGGGLSAAGEGGAIVVSTDDGVSWTSVGPNAGTIRRHVWTSPLLGWAVGDGVASRTTDGGSTWAPIVEVPFFGYNDIVFTDATHAVAMDDFGIARSDDGGVTWVHEDAFVEPLYRFRTLPLDAQHWLLATFGEGADVWETTDAGETWALRDTRGVVGYLSLAATPSGRIVWTSEAGDIRYSDDGGQTVQSATVNLSPTAYPWIIAFHDRGDGTLFAADQPSGGGEELWIRSDDGGHTWYTPAESPMLHWAQHGVFATPAIGVLGSYGEIRYTGDGADTWASAAPLPSGQRVTDIVAPALDRILLSTYGTSGGGGVFRSTDGGATWFPFGTGLPPSLDAWAIAFAGGEDGWIAGELDPSGADALYRTTDGGETWTTLAPAGLPASAADLWFASAEVGLAAVRTSAESGIFRTTNGGDTWTRVSSTQATTIRMRPDGLGLATSTWSTALQLTTDGGATWTSIDPPLAAPFALTDDYVTAALPVADGFLVGASKARILHADPVTTVSTAGGTAPPAPRMTLAPARPNPFASGTVLTFSLPADTGVRVTVHDASGRLVRELMRGDPLGAGVHEMRWDGRDARGERVAPGVYVARLDAGGAVTARKVVVIR